MLFCYFQVLIVFLTLKLVVNSFIKNNNILISSFFKVCVEM